MLRDEKSNSCKLNPLTGACVDVSSINFGCPGIIKEHETSSPDVISTFPN